MVRSVSGRRDDAVSALSEPRHAGQLAQTHVSAPSAAIGVVAAGQSASGVATLDVVGLKVGCAVHILILAASRRRSFALGFIVVPRALARVLGIEAPLVVRTRSLR